MSEKIIPPHLTFEQALRAGYAGRIECRGYREWIKTLPCAVCGKAPPSDPSHVNSFKGAGTKSPDLFCIPHCRSCHETYERGPAFADEHLRKAIMYMLRAFVEERLVWK